MPNLDHKGPDGLGPKTGKKIGKCRKTEAEKKDIYSYRKVTSKNLSTIKNEKNSSTNN